MDCGLRISDWALVVVLIVCSCDSREATKPAAPLRDISGNAVVRGKVTFSGTAPVRNQIANAPCHEGQTSIIDESVVIDAHGGLKNVVVSIEGIGPGEPRAEAPLLDQVHCTYVPHVLAVTAGQEMTIRSSDATMHNVHINATKNPAMNFAETSAGEEKRVTFNQPEVLLVKCDVHPWMTSYIAVMENPCFAVTGDDGSFEIKNVPAGTYKIATWHEQFGRLEQSITMDDAKPAEVVLEYGRR